MPLETLDHVNVRTANLAALERFYRKILGLAPGFRPDFGFPGAWLYCGARAVVHLVGVERAPKGEEPRLEHFAFLCTDLAAMRARLNEAGIKFRAARVPTTGNLQLHVFDPDGNHIELQFSKAEADAEHGPHVSTGST
jgi:catechol 2,3-dioxygenase-like lactoylglutathione lyase family enzyme